MRKEGAPFWNILNLNKPFTFLEIEAKKKKPSGLTGLCFYIYYQNIIHTILFPEIYLVPVKKKRTPKCYIYSM